VVVVGGGGAAKRGGHCASKPTRVADSEGLTGAP